jgi:hypothetical protein
MTSKLHRKASWIAVVLIIFHELTGTNAIMLYSNQIFKQMNSDGSSALTPREGTCLLGIFSLFAAMLSVATTRKFKRRTLLWLGHLIMALCHTLIAMFDYNDIDNVAIVFMLIFILVFGAMNASVCWIYCAEIATDAALGVCLFCLWATVLLLSTSINFLVNTPLSTYGTFWLLSGISLLGALFCFIFVKETQGLTDREKK